MDNKKTIRIRKIKKSGNIQRGDIFLSKGRPHTVCGIINEDHIWADRKAAVWDENGNEYDINDIELLTKQVSLGKDRNGKSLLILDEDMLVLIGINTKKPFSRREVAKKLKEYLKANLSELEEAES